MVQEKKARRKILTIGDAIAGSTGLSRIHRDIVVRMLANLSDIYEIATFGYGSPGTTKIQVPQLVIEGMSDWVCPTLPQVCADFFGEEKGIIFPIWDCSRLTWLASPRGCSELFTKFPGLQAWCASRPFELWGYLALDASGPNDRLTFPLMKTLLGFDRILAYGQWGEDLIRRTISDEESDKRHLTHLPHGIDTDVFYEVDRKLSRKLFLEYTGARHFFHLINMKGAGTTPLADDEILIDCVATNQIRKDWGLVAETCAILSRTRKIRIWVHTDSLERYWSLPNLFVDYGILDQCLISLNTIADEKMAIAYSACDITLGPGAEGWGFPLGESLACGTPVIHGSYAGGADVVPKEMQVDPIAFYKHGSYNSVRPVYRAEDWAAKAGEWIGKRAALDLKYDWANNWLAWEKYLRDAAQ